MGFIVNAPDGGTQLGLNNSSSGRMVTINTNGPSYFNGGNVGIGTMTPSTSLQIGNTTSYPQDARITMATSSGTGPFRSWSIGAKYGAADTNSPNYGFTIRDESAGVDRMVIDWATGNIGVGTETPQYPLSVNVTIQAKEVIVNTGWSDYVFDPSYKLTPLPQVATYIEQHHHLPGVPSEAQVNQKGVSLGEMQSTLLAKVEELTLRLIQLQQENKQLRELLNKRDDSMEAQIAQLKKQSGADK